jgi:hypothetical protein
VLADRLRPFIERVLAARYAPAELGRRGGASLFAKSVWVLLSIWRSRSE